MIVARGMGRGPASGVIVAFGLGLVVPFIQIPGRREVIRLKSFVMQTIRLVSKR